MNDHRLPDEDLTVLVERAAEAIATKGGHDWASLHGIAKNAIREQCLPIIFHSTKALHDLSYSKPRTITTAEELDALPVQSVIRHSNTALYEKWASGWRRLDSWEIATGPVTPELPATVLWEPK